MALRTEDAEDVDIASTPTAPKPSATSGRSTWRRGLGSPTHSRSTFDDGVTCFSGAVVRGGDELSCGMALLKTIDPVPSAPPPGVVRALGQSLPVGGEIGEVRAEF